MSSYSRTMAPELVENLEKQLRVTLRPVAPSPDFVEHLHSRLASPPVMTVERRRNYALALLLTAMSLVFGVFLLWLMHHQRPMPRPA